ncbi:MAG: helix-turn-helix domain-containing protein, partial [Acutalibacteraceae bacterium]
MCQKIYKKYRRIKTLLTSYKTEINPTSEQKQIINRTIGVCRF